ncbi:probable disease resistance protein At1g61300 [Neltuma alba]|uniref:probable disease resistance protein At1g61300 n=1 Tax=Neltuma alba TaxID=207710 RepID=UPI0010A558AF|nr:probable disease resistance protein At1g61300 [Prosopis alba]
MEKGGGRPRDDVWQHVELLEGGRRVKCKYCGREFAASANRIKSHINGDKGKGIRVCPKLVSDKGNSNALTDNLPHSQRGQIQAEANYQEMIQVGSSSVSVRENEKQEGNKRLRVDGANRHGPLEKGYILPTTDLIGEEFQKYTQQIWEWIMGDEVSAIGVWGIGGSGKTALAAHIHDKLLEEANGDIKVIWLTVSQNINIYKLQKVIAKSIKLDISDEFEVKRIARKLLQSFKEMKKCVIILDDVWDHFFLNDIGFPMLDNRIKVILTTRIREVCQGMGCEEVLKVEPLDGDDSWALFAKVLRLFGEELPSELENIAWNVAQKCEGLPLAIVRIATSMKGKTQVGEWSHMLECLANLGNGQYEMDKWVFPVLRSSYDFLTNKLQRFFLYCVLSTDGFFYDADADHLIRRFAYESIDETKKLRVQYNEGYNTLYKLKDHSMLDYYYDGWMIKKFLRVLATGIVEDTGKIMGKACKNLTEIPSDDQWKEDLQQVFLTGNHIQTIPNGTCPKCTQLSMLVLNYNIKLNHITDEFFNNMPALKTLDLSKTAIQRLPESVSNLIYLIALLLSGCGQLRYIPSLGKLKRLISLDLSCTAIAEAPLGLESLINLRSLNLLGTDKLVISPSLISKLINLECLELGRAQCLTDALVQRAQGLGKLEVTRAYFHDISIFNAFMSCPFCSSSRLVGRLRLWEMNDLKDLVSPSADSLHQSTLFSHLTHLRISECGSMKTLMPFRLLALLQNLRTICVQFCRRMKEIVGEDHSVMELTASGDLRALSHPTITLPNLTSLELDKMPELDFVYRGIMLCPSLQKFDAYFCWKLNPPQIAISNNGSVLLMEKNLWANYHWRK